MEMSLLKGEKIYAEAPTDRNAARLLSKLVSLQGKGAGAS